MNERILELIEKGKEEQEANNFGQVLYSPVVINNEIIFENARKVRNQWKRFSLLPSDFNNESILDIGTNSGYVINRLKKSHNAGYCLGIDRSQTMIDLANEIKKEEELENVDFMGSNFLEDFPITERFDNTLLFSVTGKHYFLVPSLNMTRFILKLKKITNKYIYIEPTNYERDPVLVYLDYYKHFFKQFGGAELLGETDYQGRHLFRIDART